MPGLLEYARRIASSAIELETVEYGGDPKDSPNPWLGTQRSKSPDQVSRNYMVSGTNWLYRPRSMTFKRRKGQTQKFDTFGSAVGALPAKWGTAPVSGHAGAKGRWIEEFLSSSLASDGVPTESCLATTETVTTGLDDGRYSNLWVRDQVNASDYTLGSEYSSTTYPAIGTEQTYKAVPLWYDSGDGGLTRGTSEFARRFFLSGSRRNLKAGNWLYHPSLLGTPSRWNGERATAALQTLRPAADRTDGGATGQDGGVSLFTYLSDQSTATYIRGASAATVVDLGAGVDPGTDNGHSFTYQYRNNTAHAASINITVSLYEGATLRKAGTTHADIPIGATWLSNTVTLSSAEASAITDYTNLRIQFDFGGFGAAPADNGDVAEVSFATGTSTSIANRLMPSGPFCPTHCGTLAKGTIVTGSAAVTLLPDADVTDGAWLNQSASATDLYNSINETTTDDTDYITSAALGTECVVGLSNPGFTPTSTGYTVVVNIRAKRDGTISSNASVSFSVRQGGVTKASSGTPLTISYGNFSFALTAAQIASITDWTDLSLALYIGGVERGYVSRAYISITPTADITAGWSGKHRFLYSMAYRFEDDSVWMPTPPRFPSTDLTSGFNLFTVDATSPDSRYDSVVWSNIPIAPYGVKSRILLRTLKIDSTTQDNLQLNPYDLRVVWEIQDNTTTTYTDYFADDASLGLDVGRLFIRYDHRMPPRSRYIFGGDMRVCHAYGGENPSAIVIAPVGRAADYDLNLADNSSSAYASQGSWMQIGIDTSGAGVLTLIQGDGATATNTKTFAFSTYTTLQKLVDAINATSFSVDGQQWRAQICPFANPDASTLSLTPHNRAIASCVIDNTAKTITKAAGGLSKVAVGQLISGAAEETGAYVTVITSDTSLTYTGTLTTGTETLYFYNDLGDAQITDPDTSATGFQRVIANSLPGFLYFTKTYLNTFPLEKSSVWMTVAAPGSVKSAANCFSGKTANRFIPPDASAGFAMGGGPVDQGFVTPFANAVYAIKNVRDSGSGVDEDYRMVCLNPSRGCCAWNTVVPGSRFVPYLTPHGMFAADLDGEVFLSDKIFAHPTSDATTGVGDFDYEIPLCVAATAADTDGAYASARVMRSTIFVNYRDSGATGRPDRQVQYDFSAGTSQIGLAQLFREDGRTPWGWSTELVRAFTAMGSGRRSDGEHLYGWNDANAGSTGDGRIDEFETSDTDNGTAIAADPILIPWEKGDEQRQVSAQEMVVEHTSPAGSTGSIHFYRSYSNDAYTLTPSTSDTLDVSRDPKMLTQAARVQSAACKAGFSQATGGAREMKKITLRVKRVRAYK